MIKFPYTYLFYGIISLLLFLYGMFNVFVRKIQLEWLIIIVPLIACVILLSLFAYHMLKKK